MSTDRAGTRPHTGAGGACAPADARLSMSGARSTMAVERLGGHGAARGGATVAGTVESGGGRIEAGVLRVGARRPSGARGGRSAAGAGGVAWRPGASLLRAAAELTRRALEQGGRPLRAGRVATARAVGRACARAVLESAPAPPTQDQHMPRPAVARVSLAARLRRALGW
eukprot:scaffold24680_cov221-Isochrysis_galbana.AAC.1